MKKTIVISMLTLLTLVTVFVGCNTRGNDTTMTPDATYAQATTKSETTAPAATTAPATTAAAEKATKAVKTSAEKEKSVTLEKAREIAVKDAGIGNAEVSFTKAKLDTDDGVKIYEIEFTYNGNEYEYDINAKTGAIIEKNKEPVDD